MIHSESASPRSGSPVLGSVSPLPPPQPAALPRASITGRREITSISILSPPSSSTVFSPGAASSSVSYGCGPAPDEIPMLPSSSRATFAPSGELLIDGLGVDGRDLRKGEAGWAEPFSPTFAVTPTTRRFSTRPSVDPIPAAASTTHLGLASPMVSPANPSIPLPDVTAVVPVFLQDSFGTCGALGCVEDAEQARPGVGSLGNVTIFDIVERRTCRPIALQDLKSHLMAQRQLNKARSEAAPEKKVQLPDLSLLGGTKLAVSSSSDWIQDDRDPEKTLTNSFASGPPSSRRPRSSSLGTRFKKKAAKLQQSATTGDDVDALDFVAVFNRYNRRFKALSRMQRLRSPDPAFFFLDDGPLATIDNSDGPTIGKRGLDGAITVDVVLRPSSSGVMGRSESRLGQTGSVDHAFGGLRKELTLFPSSQPLREQFDDILYRFLGRRGCGEEKGPQPEKDAQDEKGLSFKKSRPPTDRLRWMVDIGLISEEQINRALAEAEVTTHPQVLAPLADKVAVHLNEHVVPGFLDASTSNLSKGTQLGRLAVGLCCTALAILFTVLLCVNPSPFRSRNPPADVPRWWRLLTAPLWCAGVGYVLAAWTGVCVWLTIRGNHEPGDEGSGEPMPEADLDLLMLEDEGERAATARGSTAALPDEAAAQWGRADEKSWVAPELVNLLRRLVLLKPLPNASVSKAALHTAPGTAPGSNGESAAIAFSNPVWIASTFPTQQRTDAADGHVSPSLSRVTSHNAAGTALGVSKLEPLSESQSVTFDRPLSPVSITTNSESVVGGAPGMSSIGQIAASAIPGPPVTPRMSTCTSAFPSTTSIVLPTPARAPSSSPINTTLPVPPPASPVAAGLWRSPSAGTGMTIAPSVSVKSRKVPILPVAVAMVTTSPPVTNAPLPPPRERRPGIFSRQSQPSMATIMLPTVVAPDASASASRVPSFSHNEGIAYAASLYNMSTCQPRQPAPRRVLSAAWILVRRWTGFAVNTKPVLDSRVRAAQQRAALQSLVICFGLSAVILIAITALP